MRAIRFSPRLVFLGSLAFAGFAMAQDAPQNQTLVVNGQPGQASVIQMNGRSFVDVEALARITNGSLGFRGNQIVLTLPGFGGNANGPSAAPSSSQPANTGFSKDFLTAGIETMTAVREWRSAIANAIRNGSPVSESWVASYRAQAATSLRLTSVAASTSADRNAFQLVTSEFNKMQQWSNRILQKVQNMEYISPDSLDNDSLFQQILTCAHSLAAMASSNQFVDDGSCH